MSNILIIKHGSLGDLIQANGAIKDIKKNFEDHKILLLTTPAFAGFMSSCPYIDGVLIDKRLPRWNILYLNRLKKMLKRFGFVKIFDLQNSSRTKFYKKFIFDKDIFWSDSETFMDQENIKFEKNLPVLDRMEKQLNRAGLKAINFVKKPDLNWAIKDIRAIINQHFEGNFILLFPFCSPKLTKKKWPYFNDLIKLINKKYKNKYICAIAPGPNEIEEARKYDASIILNNNMPINISELISLISKSNFVISNDTGPAHICSHLNKKGLVLFGSHTTPEKVSIESENFKSIKAKKLSELPVADVFERIKETLN